MEGVHVMRKWEIIASAAAGALALCAAVPAAATTTITMGSYSLSDSQFGSALGVHSSGTQTGTSIDAYVNVDGSFVSFTSGSTLNSNGSGEAQVAGPFSDLTISFAKAWDSVTFNLDALKKTSPDFTLTVNGSTVFSGCAICSLGNGENKYIISGPHITTLSFSFTGGVADVKQVRVAGPTGVPEAATWAMMVVGFLGAGAVVRANRGRLSTEL